MSFASVALDAFGPGPLGDFHVSCMQLAVRGDVSGFERLYSGTNFEDIGLSSAANQLLLHGMATQAALNGEREMVKHLCRVRSVPVNVVPAVHAAAAAVDPFFSFDVPTPLVSALKDQDEDLAVYLLSLPQADLDLDRKVNKSTVPA